MVVPVTVALSSLSAHHATAPVSSTSFAVGVGVSPSALRQLARTRQTRDATDGVAFVLEAGSVSSRRANERDEARRLLSGRGGSAG